MVSKHDQEGSGVQKSDLGSLVERLNAPATDAEDEGKKKREPWSREKKRSALFTGLRWSGVVAALVASVLMVGTASGIQSENQAEINKNISEIRAEQARLDKATYAKEDLPEESDARRSIGRAEEAAASVAGYQNTYLDNTGPLSLEGIPTTDKDDPNKEPGTRVRTYTEKERQKLAQDRRNAQVAEAKRSLTPYFDASSRDATGVDATEPWHRQVTTMQTEGDTVSLAEYEWSTPAVQAFSPDGSVEVLWLLTKPSGNDNDKDKDKAEKKGADAVSPSASPAAWARATYNPITGTFEHLSVGTYQTKGN